MRAFPSGKWTLHHAKVQKHQQKHSRCITHNLDRGVARRSLFLHDSGGDDRCARVCEGMLLDAQQGASWPAAWAVLGGWCVLC